jgi:hypothetical protein
LVSGWLLGDVALREGDVMTLDGKDGAIYASALEIVVGPHLETRSRLWGLREPRVDAVKEPVA